MCMPTSSPSRSCLWANEGNSSDLLGALDAATTPGSRHLAVKKSNKNSKQCSLLPHFHLTLWCCYISVYQYTAYNLPLIPATSGFDLGLQDQSWHWAHGRDRLEVAVITLAIITASSRMTRKRGNFKFQVHPHNRQTTAECDSELSRRKFKMALGTVT